MSNADISEEALLLLEHVRSADTKEQQQKAMKAIASALSATERRGRMEGLREACYWALSALRDDDIRLVVARAIDARIAELEAKP